MGKTMKTDWIYLCLLSLLDSLLYLPVNNIDRYYIWCFGIHIVDCVKQKTDCRLNNTVNRVSKAGVVATRKTVVLLYERPYLIPC
jgi:hypothetical protein